MSQKQPHKKYLIEFRNGAFFQSLEASQGGVASTAKVFPSKEEAEKFMGQYP